MAWELANEPRCGADGVRNLPRSKNCTPEIITEWIDEMSTYVKSLDKDHLVTWGGEGGFNRPSDDGFYNGFDGGDYDKELALKNVDFGTFHTYPDCTYIPSRRSSISSCCALTDYYQKQGGQRASSGLTSGSSITPQPLVQSESQWYMKSTVG